MIWVQMVCPKVNLWNGDETREIRAFGKGVWIGVWIGISRGRDESKPFITDGHHMIPVKALDVFRRLLGPLGDDGSVTSFTSRFIRQLPCQNGCRVDVWRDDRFDVFLILILAFCGCVPFALGWWINLAEPVVSLHAAIVIPIVDKWDYQLDSSLFGRFDHIVEALKTIRTYIYGWSSAIYERLEPDRSFESSARFHLPIDPW
jgi:hypothetical protein